MLVVLLELQLSTLMKVCPIASTRRWIKTVVLGLNLCPWAREAKIVVASDPVATSVREMPLVESSTLLVLEHMDFQEYLGVAADVDEAIDSHGYRGILQLATFHPEYDYGYDEVENFTNRSPFPLLHLLKEEDVSRAAQTDTEVVWRRNIATCHRIGIAELRRKLQDCYVCDTP